MSSPKQKLLLVDDSVIVGKRINTILSELAFIEVLGQAIKGEEAMQMISDRIPDIILLDINIPGSSGFDILSWLSETYENIKVVMLSNHSTIEYRNLAFSLGADHFLDKATEFDKLPQLLLELSKQ